MQQILQLTVIGRTPDSHVHYILALTPQFTFDFFTYLQMLHQICCTGVRTAVGLL